MNNNVGKVLKLMRTKRNMSVDQVCAILNIKSHMLIDYENSNYPFPKVLIEPLCNVFFIKVEDFYRNLNNIKGNVL